MKPPRKKRPACALTLFKIADVSTRHVTRSDGLLMGSDVGAVAQINGGYGTIFSTCDTSLEHLESKGYSAALLKIMRHAQQHTVGYVRFDADGADIDGWPTFDW
jgi:hypothetical protein